MSVNLSQTIIPNHLGIIMDWNGRWAQQRGLPRITGHQQGVHAVKRTVEDYAEIGVKILTLYTFFTENWCRPKMEVDYLMRLAEKYLRTGGEWRLSNFLLWRAANAVFWSMPVLWLDFRKEHLQEAIGIYTKQIRGGNVNA
jgi:undecaprenyl diphosphate synthase